MANIIDLIEAYWGTNSASAIGRADTKTLRRFGYEVNKFYDSYTVPTPKKEALNTYFGGLAATNFALAGHSASFFNALLYAHSTIVPDPLAEWYFRDVDGLQGTPAITYSTGMTVDQSEKMGWMLRHFKAFQEDLDGRREILQYYVGGLLKIAPLIRAGIVIPISQAHVVKQNNAELIETALKDASDHTFQNICDKPPDELHPVWDNIRGLVFLPGNPPELQDADRIRWARAKESGYHINKNLMIAEAGSALYVPTNETDKQLFLKSLQNRGKEFGAITADIFATSAAAMMKIPSIEGVDIAELATIRANEGAFEAFRSSLAETLMSSTNSPEEAARNSSKQLEEEIRVVREKLKDSKVLKTAIRDEGLGLWLPLIFLVIEPTKMGAAKASTGILARLFQKLRTRFKDTNEVLLKLASVKRMATDKSVATAKDVSALPKAFSRVFMGQVRTTPPPAGVDPATKSTAINFSGWSRTRPT